MDDSTAGENGSVDSLPCPSPQLNAAPSNSDILDKKAYTAWLNKYMERDDKIEDLFTELRDGKKLIVLLNKLIPDANIHPEVKDTVYHRRQNVKAVLDTLEARKPNCTQSTTVDSIVNGVPKSTLGLIWIIFLHFAGGPSDQSLLKWAQEETENYQDRGVNVTDFKHSWRNGMAFCALIHKHKPELLNFDGCDKDEPLENLRKAFEAGNKLGVPHLIDPKDVNVKEPPQREIQMYVLSLKEAFSNPPPNNSSSSEDCDTGDIAAASLIKWLQNKQKQMDMCGNIGPNSSMINLQLKLTEAIQHEMDEQYPRNQELSGHSNKPSAQVTELQELWDSVSERLSTDIKRLKEAKTLAQDYEEKTSRLRNQFNQTLSKLAAIHPVVLSSSEQNNIDGLKKVVTECKIDHEHDAARIKNCEKTGVKLAAISPEFQQTMKADIDQLRAESDGVNRLINTKLNKLQDIPVAKSSNKNYENKSTNTDNPILRGSPIVRQAEPSPSLCSCVRFSCKIFCKTPTCLLLLTMAVLVIALLVLLVNNELHRCGAHVCRHSPLHMLLAQYINFNHTNYVAI